MTMWAMCTALAVGIFIAPHLSAVAKPVMPDVAVGQMGWTASQFTGLIDHSHLARADLPEEPNPALLHSDPTAYEATTAGSR